ncbi:response regulator [Aeromonas fluvialis]|uniref:response regulator n=1 Tax=Aeromonas fluvialis TaxID=591962 RepID=UPI0005A9107F|nr:response regulator [Aeromonas fluvialis]
MIITDEELLALLDSEEHAAAEFFPVLLYALDQASHELAKSTTLPSYVALQRTQPDACWQWEGLFAAGSIALYEPAAHLQADYFPELQHHQGVYAIGEDWLGGLAASYRDWRNWLAAKRVLLLEDHPFQGEQLQQTIAALGLSCQWVKDEAACLAALEAGDTNLLVCDLSLVEQDAISLLMNQPQLQEAGLPIVLLSAHEQTLIDGARRLLHDAGFNVLAALAKPLDEQELLRLLRGLYLGPLRQHRLSGQRRTIRHWQGEVQGQLGLLSSPATPHPVWLAVTGLPSRWEALKEWLMEQSRSSSELTLLIHRRDNLLSNGERFALVLQASLAGSKLALLLDNSQHLPFDLLERLPLSALLLGQAFLPEIASLAMDSLLGRFMARVRELGIAVYLDDPYNLLDAEVWREHGIAGRW